MCVNRMSMPNSTELIFVLDRSGSMATTAEAMKEGFNGLIVDQKKLPGDCQVTLAQFDDQYEVVYQGKPLAEVPALVLEPRGWTCLLDAIGKTIQTTGQRLAALPESERPSQVLMVIITDGQENRSVEYKAEKIFDMITHQRQSYKWEFMFLGAAEGALKTAKSYGISMGNAVNYVGSASGTRHLVSGISAGLRSYRSAGKPQMEGILNQAMYDASLKDDKSGDKKEESKP